MNESFLDAEAGAQKKLEPELRRHVDLTISAFPMLSIEPLGPLAG